MKKDVVLVIGASGQIGSDLVAALRSNLGNDNVVASDIKEGAETLMGNGPFEQLDILDGERLLQIIKKHEVTQVYLLAALLSAIAEQKVNAAWKLNMEGLMNVLDLAKQGEIDKIYWPSSIAVFGPSTPKDNTPQYTIMEPNTVYGISKLAGERWCEYYYQRFGVDVRSLRYPGLIGHSSPPGGGTTDYAVNIFHDALTKKTYECFLDENTKLPMMYMDDAIRATLSIMEAPSESIKIRSSYNIAGFSFTPAELTAKITQHIQDFTCSYSPDSRQKIADSWPRSIDDSCAKQDWQWLPQFNTDRMVEDMIKNLEKKYTQVS